MRYLSFTVAFSALLIIAGIDVYAQDEAPFLFRAAAEPFTSDLGYVVDKNSKETNLPEGVKVLRVLPGTLDLPFDGDGWTDVETIISVYWPTWPSESYPRLSIDVLKKMVAAPKLKKLRLRGTNLSIGAAEMKIIAQAEGLEELDVYPVLRRRRQPVEEPEVSLDISLLRKCTNLKRLRLGPIITPFEDPVGAFRQLSQLTQLESLHLVRCDIPAAGLVYLSRLPRLKELCLQDCHIKDQGLELIGEFFKLTDVSLTQSQGFSEYGVAKLFKMGTLTGLDLKTCDVKFPKIGIQYADGIESLERLRVSGDWREPPLGQSETIEPHWTTPEDLCRELSKLPRFRELWFENVPGDYYTPGMGWGFLDRLPKLETLSLKGCGALNEHACKAIAKLGNLKVLNIERCVLSESLVAALEELTNLEQLSFTVETGKPDHGIFGVLPKRDRLTVLSIHGRRSPVDLPPVVLPDEVVRLPKLKALYLKELTVGPLPDQLENLSTTVESITISYCKGLDSAGAESIALISSVQYLDLTGTLNGLDAKRVRATRKPLITVIWD